MKYRSRTCKRCKYYNPDMDGADPCVICSRYLDDWFREREE